ncbi:hypothetical protein ES703_83784 [subsurface metagenome]
MPYRNPKELLDDATKLPAAIEAKLPAGAPKISTTLVTTAAGLPKLPDFPMAIPDLPAPPELPAIAPPVGIAPFVTGVPPVAAPTPPAPPAPALRTPVSRLVFE